MMKAGALAGTGRQEQYLQVSLVPAFLVRRTLQSVAVRHHALHDSDFALTFHFRGHAFYPRAPFFPERRRGKQNCSQGQRQRATQVNHSAPGRQPPGKLLTHPISGRTLHRGGSQPVGRDPFGGGRTLSQGSPETTLQIRYLRDDSSQQPHDSDEVATEIMLRLGHNRRNCIERAGRLRTAALPGFPARPVLGHMASPPPIPNTCPAPL